MSNIPKTFRTELAYHLDKMDKEGTAYEVGFNNDACLPVIAHNQHTVTLTAGGDNKTTYIYNLDMVTSVTIRRFP